MLPFLAIRAASGSADPCAALPSGRWIELPGGPGPVRQPWVAADPPRIAVLTNGGYGAEGAVYDTCAARWTAVAAPDYPRANSDRWGHGPSWPAGLPLPGGALVFGALRLEPGDGGPEFVYAARLDLAAARFAPLSRDGDPVGRQQPATAWDGRRLAVWGGAVPTPQPGGGLLPVPARDGAIWDAVTDRWSPIPAEGAPEGQGAAGTWAGNRLAVWGGVLREPRTCGKGDPCPPARAGGWFDPARGGWTPIPGEGAPDGVLNPVLAWTGEALVVYGGRGPDAQERYGGATFDPARGAWAALPPSPLGPGPYGAEWVGGRVVLLRCEAGAFRAAVLDPATGTFAVPPPGPCGGPMTPLPDPRHVVLRWLVRPEPARLGRAAHDGALVTFDPALPGFRSTPLPLDGAPLGWGPAVVAGDLLFVWGGRTVDDPGGQGGCGGPREAGAPECDPVVVDPTYEVDRGYLFRLDR